MTTAVLVEYVDQHREEFGVEPICSVLRKAGMQIAPRSYYAAKTRPPSARGVADAQRLTVMRNVVRAESLTQSAHVTRAGHR